MVPLLVAVLTFSCLAFASWCVGEGGEILGKKYDASIIGGLIIAWLNTAPEAIFFITALTSNNSRFAVGAVSGSSIVVCTVALGCCLWIGAKKRLGNTIQLQPPVKKQCLILLTSLVFPSLITVVGYNIFLGGLAVVYYLGFIGYSLLHKLPDAEEKDDDDTEMTISNNNGSTTELEHRITVQVEEEHEEPLSKGIGYLFLGGIIICFFSKPFIDSIVQLASVWNINPILLAFFLAPIASEMPEILESISLSRKGSSQNINIAFSNLIGGTITKTTLLMGIFCFFGHFKEFEWEIPTYPLSLLLLTFCAGVASSIGYFVPKIKDYHGGLLFFIFALSGFIQYYYNVSFDSPTNPDAI
eukprot:gene1920-2355_t